MPTTDAPLYLDYNATTPIHPEVADVMAPLLREGWGNPSSAHEEGRKAKAALDKARAQVASVIGASPNEIVFTSGGSEADNLAIVGTLDARRDRGRHIVTTAIEHPAVLAPLVHLEAMGRAEVTVVGVRADGCAVAGDLAAVMREETVLVSMMHSNNETGALQPVAEVAEAARAAGAWVHSDAAQSVGKVPVDVKALGVDLLTVVGHKLYGPKGVGALFVRDGIDLTPLIHGASQERGRRAGTENVLLAAGLGAACALAERELDQLGTRLGALRDRLEAILVEGLGDRAVVQGPREARLPNTLNICIRGVVGADVLAGAPEVLASTGSACHAGAVELSPVLKAMGVAPEVGMGALRLTLGRSTGGADVDRAGAAIVRAAKALLDG
jgi:cysteine desulfurase